MVGNLFDFSRDPLRFLTKLTQEYGDVASCRLAGRTLVHVSDPELIREILVEKHRSFLKTGFLKRATPVLGNGLVTSEGDVHRRQRRLIQPALNRQRVPAYADEIVQVTEQTSQSWHDGQSVDMFDEMLDLTLHIITRTLFSTDVGQQAEQIEHALTVVIEHFTRMLSPFGRLRAQLPGRRRRDFRSALRVLDKFVYGMLHARRTDGSTDRGDVLSMLLQARDVDGDGGMMPDTQIRDEVMTLFTAGHETIATALTWTMYSLAKNPHVYDLLRQELDNVLGERLPTADDVSKLTYTEMVFAESMRLHPPVWGMTRLVASEETIGEYRLPVGTVVGLTQFVVQRDPRHFEAPECFIPERWTAEARASRPKYSYFPFGGGPRLCIGETLSWLEGILVLATVCRQWQPEVAPEFEPGFKPLITLRPAAGMPITLRRRESEQSEPDKVCSRSRKAGIQEATS